MKTNSFKRLVTLVKRLRGPDGCPHDKYLTLCNWADFIDGEMRELKDAIDSNDTNNMCEELGDVMWCLVNIGSLAEDAGLFSLEAALNGVVDKMMRRHPHVFGDAVANTPDEANALYCKAKAEEQKEKADTAQDLSLCFLCGGGSDVRDVRAVHMRAPGKSTVYMPNAIGLCKHCRDRKNGSWRYYHS